MQSAHARQRRESPPWAIAVHDALKLGRACRSDDLALDIHRAFAGDVTLDQEIVCEDAATGICTGGFGQIESFAFRPMSTPPTFVQQHRLEQTRDWKATAALLIGKEASFYGEVVSLWGSRILKRGRTEAYNGTVMIRNSTR